MAGTSDSSFLLTGARECARATFRMPFHGRGVLFIHRCVSPTAEVVMPHTMAALDDRLYRAVRKAHQPWGYDLKVFSGVAARFTKELLDDRKARNQFRNWSLRPSVYPFIHFYEVEDTDWTGPLVFLVLWGQQRACGVIRSATKVHSKFVRSDVENMASQCLSVLYNELFDKGIILPTLRKYASRREWEATSPGASCSEVYAPYSTAGEVGLLARLAGEAHGPFGIYFIVNNMMPPGRDDDDDDGAGDGAAGAAKRPRKLRTNLVALAKSRTTLVGLADELVKVPWGERDRRQQIEHEMKKNRSDYSDAVKKILPYASMGALAGLRETCTFRDGMKGYAAAAAADDAGGAAKRQRGAKKNFGKYPANLVADLVASACGGTFSLRMGPDLTDLITSFLCKPSDTVPTRCSGREGKIMETWRDCVGEDKAPRHIHAVFAEDVRMRSVQAAVFNASYNPDTSLVLTMNTTSGVFTSKGLGGIEDIATHMKKEAATPNRKVMLVLHVVAAEYPNPYFLASERKS